MTTNNENKTNENKKESMNSAYHSPLTIWIHDFVKDPYRSERVFAPFDKALNNIFDLPANAKASAAARKAARAEAKEAGKQKAAAVRRAFAELGMVCAIVLAAGLCMLAVHPSGRALLNIDKPLTATEQQELSNDDSIINSPPADNAVKSDNAEKPDKFAMLDNKLNGEAAVDVQTTAAVTATDAAALSTTVSAADSAADTANDAAVDSENESNEKKTIYVRGKNGGKIELSHYYHSDHFLNATPLRMIDISSNQGKIDWEKVAQTDVDVAMIRVGYRARMTGELHEDRLYEYNLSEAQKYGIPYGVYIYSQAITPLEAIEEAEYLLELIEGYDVSLPVTIDFEHEAKSVYGKPGGRLFMAKLSKDQATDVIEAFCNKVSKSGYEAMVYANKDMIAKGLHTDELSKNYKIWLACYGRSAGYDGIYSAWQFTDKGKVDGIKGDVCLDFWYEDGNSSSNDTVKGE